MKKLIAFLMILTVLTICATAAPAEGMMLAAPNGAPAIAVSTIAEEHPEQFSFVEADTIAAEFANATADFIIAPINAGAKLFKAGKSTYQLAAVITWGNLVFASQKENFKIEDIEGSVLTLFGENTINASVALYILEKKGIHPASVEYLAGASHTQQLLLSEPDAIVMTAEPAATAAMLKNEAIKTISLNDEMQIIAGVEGYTQAGLFVKAETAEKDPEGVKAYLNAVQEASGLIESELEKVVNATVSLQILPNAKIATQAIPKCGIHYVPATEAKEQVELTANIDLTQFGGSIPADEFYYAIP